MTDSASLVLTCVFGDTNVTMSNVCIFGFFASQVFGRVQKNDYVVLHSLEYFEDCSVHYGLEGCHKSN